MPATTTGSGWPFTIEATVKKALEAVPGVSVEKVSHEEGVAVVLCADAVDPAALQKAVEDKDYTVTGME